MANIIFLITSSKCQISHHCNPRGILQEVPSKRKTSLSTIQVFIIFILRLKTRSKRKFNWHWDRILDHY